MQMEIMSTTKATMGTTIMMTVRDLLLSFPAKDRKMFIHVNSYHNWKYYKKLRNYVGNVITNTMEKKEGKKKAFSLVR